MPIKTLRGLRKEQNRQTLIDNNFQVVRHRMNFLQTDTMLQIAVNRLAKATNQPFYKVFHLINVQKNALETYARVNKNTGNNRIVDVHTVCLLHGNPEHLHPSFVLRSCSDKSKDNNDLDTNIVVNQAAVTMCPTCNEMLEVLENIQVSINSYDIVDNEDW
jgi:hypothetical protein